LGVAILLIRRYARTEGVDPGRTAEAIVLTIAVGFFGARVFELILHWDRYVGTPGGLKLLLFSTGSFLGGLITAVPYCVFWFRHIRLPVLLGLDLLALAGCVAEGIGRWGCFFSGCCYGTPSDLPWAVTFPEAARRLHAGLPDVPIHPTQIYLSINAFSILLVLVWLYRRKRFHGQIMAAYAAMYAVTRFLLERFRGDADRDIVLGGPLSASQIASVLLGVAAVTAYVALDVRHRRRDGTDGRPAASSAK
jgi:phosphatidylglycerol:prolipoprotein diacylglycerol transferase